MLKSRTNVRMGWAVAAALLAFGGPAGADVVTDLGGIALRVNASDLSLTDLDPVASWGPLSAGGIAQPTYIASDASFGGAAAVRFDGTSDYMTGPAVSNTRSIYAVVTRAAGAPNLAGLISNGSDQLNVRRDNTTNFYRSPGHNGDNNDYYRAGGSIGGSMEVAGVVNGSVADDTAHLVVATSGAQQNFGSFYLGQASVGGAAAGRFWKGDVAEVIVFNRALTISDHNQVVRYVNAAYSLSTPQRTAGTILGTGTGALLGGDSTDPENDGAADANTNYNVVQFIGNQEPAFGAGEAAFNVFDNRVGPSNDKWCCGDPVLMASDGLYVGAQFASAGLLDRFTVTSSNDTPGRDPIRWAIQGSADGSTWVDVFVQDAAVALWTARNQVIQFTNGVDYNAHTNYDWYRYIAYATGNGDHALAELEFFVIPTPAALPAGLVMLVGLGLRRRR